MANVKKTLSEKESDLKKTIADAQKKLKAIQSKKVATLGELACKHGLHEFNLEKIDSLFKKIAEELKTK